MADTSTTLTIATAILAAGMCFGIPASRASAGDAPWCIVGYEGHLHCEYRTSQECLQALAAGNRGFCNVNPTAQSSTRAVVAQPESRKRRPQKR